MEARASLGLHAPAFEKILQVSGIDDSKPGTSPVEYVNRAKPPGANRLHHVILMNQIRGHGIVGAVMGEPPFKM